MWQLVTAALTLACKSLITWSADWPLSRQRHTPRVGVRFDSVGVAREFESSLFERAGVGDELTWTLTKMLVHAFLEYLIEWLSVQVVSLGGGWLHYALQSAAIITHAARQSEDEAPITSVQLLQPSPFNYRLHPVRWVLLQQRYVGSIYSVYEHRVCVGKRWREVASTCTHL